MKAILMSIKPKWCEKIFSGKKTIEVRKTAPKLELPFKVYVYCTKDGMDVYGNAKRYVTDTLHILNENAAKAFEKTTGLSKWNGKVVGEFICERVTEHEICDSGAVVNYWAEGLQHSCLTVSQIDEYVGKRSSSDYGKKSKVYGLHISDLKIYDKPKELSEFKKGCNDMYDPQFGSYCGYCPHPCFLTRPPQSWMYIEELC